MLQCCGHNRFKIEYLDLTPLVKALFCKHCNNCNLLNCKSTKILPEHVHSLAMIFSITIAFTLAKIKRLIGKNVAHQSFIILKHQFCYKIWRCLRSKSFSSNVESCFTSNANHIVDTIDIPLVINDKIYTIC